MTTPTASAADERRVVILTSRPRDGAITVDLLRGEGIVGAACDSFSELLRQIDRGAAVILIAEEVLAENEERALAAVISRQPPWSDLPIIMLTREGADSDSVAHAVRTLGNVTLLERPTRLAALVSAVHTALRARERQYQIRAHLQERERIAQSLNDADRRKNEFLAMLAHELRNPLAPICNAVQVLRLTRTTDPVAAHMCEVMQRQIDHMVRLVDDLLDVSRITRGKITLHRERTDLTAIIRNAIDISRPLIDAAGHRLSIHTLDTPIPIDGDAIRLTQVVANLLNNAAKYTPARGQITITAQKRDGRAAISVRDNGEGMTPEMLPRVFDLFIQGPPAEAQARGGLGIGLTLVRQLVELHGGIVEAFSEGLGKGSEFVVTLPLLVDTEASADDPAGWDRRDRLDGRRILIVDDNADGADSLGMLLEMLGAKVRVVYSGHAALAELDVFQPSVVLLDVGMPELDGYAVARLIRQRDGFDDVTIVAITGWGQAEDRVQSREAGIDHHITKPPDPERLKKLLLSTKETKARSRNPSIG